MIRSPFANGSSSWQLGIEDADDLAPDADRAGNPDARAVARVIRSAMLVLPLPGRPYRNSPLPDVIAAPGARTFLG